jgi:hypothetical protein
MLIVVVASVAMPVSITAPPAVVNRNEDAGREEQQTSECEDDQTDETHCVTSHDSSPRRNRGCFSASFSQENTAAYWTFATYGPRSGGRVLLVALTAYGGEQDVGDRTKS